MTTKAELAAELAALRQEYARTAPLAAKQPEPASETAPDKGPESSPDLSEFLASHDLQDHDPEQLLHRLTRELDQLSHDKPLLTASMAFGLGFALGRMSKRTDQGRT